MDDRVICNVCLSQTILEKIVHFLAGFGGFINIAGSFWSKFENLSSVFHSNGGFLIASQIILNVWQMFNIQAR